MNDSNKSSNGLLVLKLSKPTTANMIDELTEVIAPIADKLGVEPMVLPPGIDVELKMGSEALLLRVCEALEKIAMSDQAPVLETQEGPSERPTLNSRSGTLNSRDPILYPANNGGKSEAPPVGDPLPGKVEPAPLPERGDRNSREPIGTHHGCDFPNIPKEGTFLLDPSERIGHPSDRSGQIEGNGLNRRSHAHLPGNHWCQDKPRG